VEKYVTSILSQVPDPLIFEQRKAENLLVFRSILQEVGYAANTGYLPYHELTDPSEFLARLRELGVTHVLHQSPENTALFRARVANSIYQLQDDEYLDWLANKQEASDVTYYELRPFVLLAALERQGHLRLLHEDLDTVVESRVFRLHKQVSFAVYVLQE